MTINGFQIKVVRTGKTIFQQAENQKYIAIRGDVILVSKSMESLTKRIKKLDSSLTVCR